MFSRIYFGVARYLLRYLRLDDAILQGEDNDCNAEYLFLHVMNSRPRCCGRFAVYMRWLLNMRSSHEAYMQFTNIMQKYPELVPHFSAFIILCVNAICHQRQLYGSRDNTTAVQRS